MAERYDSRKVNGSPDVFCPQCGTRNPASSRFCYACGSLLYHGESQSDAADVLERESHGEPTGNEGSVSSASTLDEDLSVPRDGPSPWETGDGSEPHEGPDDSKPLEAPSSAFRAEGSKQAEEFAEALPAESVDESERDGFPHGVTESRDHHKGDGFSEPEVWLAEDGVGGADGGSFIDADARGNGDEKLFFIDDMSSEDEPSIPIESDDLAESDAVDPSEGAGDHDELPEDVSPAEIEETWYGNADKKSDTTGENVGEGGPSDEWGSSNGSADEPEPLMRANTSETPGSDHHGEQIGDAPSVGEQRKVPLGLLIGLVAAVAVVAILATSFLGGGGVAVAKGANSYWGEPTESVISALKELGFENIRTFNMDGTSGEGGVVERISIAGDAEFEANEVYPPDATVVITWIDDDSSEKERKAESESDQDNEDSKTGTEVKADVPFVDPGAAKTSEGLEYEENGDGTCTLKGVGTFSGKSLVIGPTNPSGEKITKIDDYAFMELEGVEDVQLIDLDCQVGGCVFEYGKFKTVTMSGGTIDADTSFMMSCENVEQITISNCNFSTADYSFMTFGNNAKVEFNQCTLKLGSCSFEYANVDTIKMEKCSIDADSSFLMGSESVSSLVVKDSEVSLGDYSCMSFGKDAVVELQGDSIVFGDCCFEFSDMKSLSITGKTLEAGTNFATGADCGTLTLDCPKVTCGEYTCSSVSELTDVAIAPNGPGNTVELGDNSFTFCTNLKNVTIGSGSITLGTDCFSAGTSNFSLTIAGKAYKPESIAEGLKV